MTEEEGEAIEIDALRADVEECRREIARLRRENAELLKTILDRDYERPPHYR